VLIDPPAGAAWNMAVDEVLLEAAAAGAWTLRLYAWRRPTVSLGYAQRGREAFDAGAARRLGVGVVRRPTGGRAVLHADELTYALAAPTSAGPLAAGIGASYRLISSGLQAGLESLGAAVRLERSAGAGAAARGPCFAARARFELTFAGRKMAGSAQRRRDRALLQHGSLLLGRPDPRLWRALGGGHEEAAAASIGLVEALGCRPSPARLAACLARGIGAALGLEPRTARLSRAQRRRAAVPLLLAARYSRRWSSRDFSAGCRWPLRACTVTSLSARPG
jgi:lipoate-protein ligase A